MKKKFYLFLLISICLIFFSLQINNKKILNVAYLNQKYPYFYLKNDNITDITNWDNFNGIEHTILKELAKKLELKINLSFYDKTKDYDIIIGGIIYSKQIEQIFKSYSFIKYFIDSISVYCLSQNNLDIDTFKKADGSVIGVIMYSYAYYLIKQYIPKIKIYAYKEDILQDLLEGKVLYIIVDDNYFIFPPSFKQKVKKVSILYREQIGILVSRLKSNFIKELDNIINNLNIMELLKWLE